MDFNGTASASTIPTLQFNPDKYPHATLKAFNEFIQQYEYRYIAQYPEPPKNAIDNSIERWKMVNDKAPTNDIIEEVRRQWISKDKVRKLLGFFATVRLQQD